MNNQLKIFQNEILLLADEVENEWHKKSFELDCFPQLSKEILENYIPSSVPSVESFFNDIESIDLPRQTFSFYEFSDLPLTLARKEKFSIDVYLWTHSDTNIHDHHFSGAFKIISGNSLQFNYKFKPTKSLGNDIEEGELTLDKFRKLTTNTTQAIEPSSNFIHHVFHLNKPTITLCIRTDFFREKLLNSYIYPKYKIQNRLPTPEQIRKLKFLSVRLACNDFPKELPFHDSEILIWLYFTMSGRMKIDLPLWDKLKDHLVEKDFAPDFFNLLNSQGLRNQKLKIFGLKD